MALGSRERVGRALEILAGGLGPFVDSQMSAFLPAGRDWLAVMADRAQRDGRPPVRLNRGDPRLLLRVIGENPRAFAGSLGRRELAFAQEIRAVANDWAHHEDISAGDAERALDTIARLLGQIGAGDLAAEVSGLAAGVREPRLQAGAPPEPRSSPAASAPVVMAPEPSRSRDIPARTRSGVSGTVLVVAAGFAYPRQYLAASAYACQPGRSFRRDVDWIAFYASGAIREHVARIWYWEDQVLISGAEAAARRAGGAAGRGVAAVIEATLRNEPGQEGTRRQVFLLSGPDAPETIRLPQPIMSDARSSSGRPCAWVQSQRYVPLAALTRPGVRVTSDLTTGHGL